MKNVLFILGSYLPYASANGICVEKVAHELLKHDATVVCLAERSDKNTRKVDMINGVTVYRVDANWHDFITIDKLNRNSKIDWLIKLFFNFLRRATKFFELLFWPLDLQGKTKRMKKEAMKLQKQYCFDTIICIYKPYNSFLVGHHIKKQYPNIKLVSYLLDSISGGEKELVISQRVNDKKKATFEKNVLLDSDLILAMESSRKRMTMLYSNKGYYKKISFIDVPLFKETPCYNDVRMHPWIKPDKTNIVFCGAMRYPTRNIKYWVDVFSHMEGVNVILVGSTNVADYLENAQTTTNGIVNYYHAVTHEEIDKLLPCADIFLNFGVQLPCAISGKIFEYISYGKPIISSYSIDDEASIPYLKKYPMALLLDERISDVNLQVAKIKDFISEVHRKDKENVNINKYYQNTPQAFFKALSADYAL